MNRVFLILFLSVVMVSVRYISEASATHSNQSKQGVGHQDQGEKDSNRNKKDKKGKRGGDG